MSGRGSRGEVGQDLRWGRDLGRVSAGLGVSSPRAGHGAGSRWGGAGSSPEPGSGSGAGSSSGPAVAWASHAGGARGVHRALVGRVAAQRSALRPATAASGQHLQPRRRNLPGGKLKIQERPSE